MLGIVLVALAGCMQPQTRGQMSEEPDKDLDIRTIGDVTEVSNVAPLQVSGVGLVTGLSGTGHSPQSDFRKMLEQELMKKGIEDVKRFLDSPDVAIVLVTGHIAAGCRQGDLFDVEISLPPGSKTTSLAGGVLRDCPLRTHKRKEELSENYQGSNSTLLGHVMARASGHLMVGLSGGEEEAEARRARIWQGGTSLIERPLFFVMRNDERSIAIANSVAQRINYMFQDDQRRVKWSQQEKNLILLGNVTSQLNEKHRVAGMQSTEMAKAVTKEVLNVRVPYIYRHNPERFLRVARLTPLREDSEALLRYRRKLEAMLVDPTQTVRAALRLEALGKDGVNPFKQGLNHDHALVRFVCAESMCYLDNTAGVEELARLGQQHPEFTNLAVTALASMNQEICRNLLSTMTRQEDPCLRTAAFMGMRLCCDDYDPRLGGEHVGRSFWVYQIPSQASPFVHFSLAKRAEIVQFGKDIELVTPVRLLIGQDYTVSAEQGDRRITVSRITGQGGVQQKQCTLELDQVLTTIAQLGGGYVEAVDLLRKLQDRQGLNCPIRSTALPPDTTIEELVALGRNPNFLRK
jgi:hypothetical protein